MTLMLSHIDLFVLDVEGAELDVIQGMHGSSVLPVHIFIEHEHVGLDLCAEKLSELGYALVWNDWCNSMFIRKC